MKQSFKSTGLLVATLTTVLVSSCKHEIPVPTDPGNNGGGGGGGGGSTIVCDPDTIYFENDIQPLLNTYCGKEGDNLSCHSVNDAHDNVIMVGYLNVIGTGDININGDPFDSDFWDVLTETDPDKQMPPPGQPQLSPAQLAMIQTWLSQGALNNACACSLNNCDSTLVSFAADVKPLIDGLCVGCHNTANAGNKFVGLATYSDLTTTSLANDRLMKAIRHTGLWPMPKNGAKMCDCDIAKISNWISEGALNN